MTLIRPTLALPEPLRAAEQPSFTHHSVVTRLPNIARRALAENPFPAPAVEQIQALIDEIPAGPIRAVNIPLAPDADEWAGYICPYLGQSWLQVPWFFAEEYFYVRILEASGYFAPGEWRKRDPYKHQKNLGLTSTRADIRVLAGQIDEALALPASAFRDSLARLLLADLWGNQNDLSMWPVHHDGGGGSAAGRADEGGSSEDELEAAQARILSNDLQAVLDHMVSSGQPGARVDILLDNAGYELLADLALADFLLSTGYCDEVVLHAKSHPVFVSDALVSDILATLEFLVFDGDPHALGMAVRLRTALVAGRLALRPHPFWTSPLAAWEMPAGLAEDLCQSHLLISKGDANYRRLLGDRHWPHELPFAQVVDYFPCPVLALRTLKSEITIGLDPARTPTTDPDWMINGRWGLVQFADRD